MVTGYGPQDGRRSAQGATWLDAKSVLLVTLLVVVGIGAVAELVAGRSVSSSEARRATSWEVLIEVGEAARSRGDAPAARRAYLQAMFRARGEGSVVGLLKAAEGFKALGDRAVVEQALRMAADLGAGRHDPAYLQGLRDRLDAADALPITVPAPR